MRTFLLLLVSCLLINSACAMDEEPLNNNELQLTCASGQVLARGTQKDIQDILRDTNERKTLALDFMHGYITAGGMALALTNMVDSMAFAPKDEYPKMPLGLVINYINSVGLATGIMGLGAQAVVNRRRTLERNIVVGVGGVAGFATTFFLYLQSLEDKLNYVDSDNS